MMQILKNVFNFPSHSQNVCFPVSFTNSCLEYNVGLTKPKVYFARFQHSKGWGVRCLRQLLWEGSSNSILKWLHSYHLSYDRDCMWPTSEILKCFYLALYLKNIARPWRATWDHFFLSSSSSFLSLPPGHLAFYSFLITPSSTF